MSEEPSVWSAGPDDEAGVVAAVTLAFAADPVARWAVPDTERYLAMMPDMVRAFGGNGFAHGTVYAARGGAAMWLPPGIEPDHERMGALSEAHVPADRLDDLMALMDGFAAHHPDEPHWYLPLIGVDPALQGRGIGDALMRHALARCDAEGALAYLESSSPRNIPLYERHGFERLGVIQVGSSPEVVPMLRQPRRPGA